MSLPQMVCLLFNAHSLILNINRKWEYATEQANAHAYVWLRLRCRWGQSYVSHKSRTQNRQTVYRANMRRRMNQWAHHTHNIEICLFQYFCLTFSTSAPHTWCIFWLGNSKQSIKMVRFFFTSFCERIWWDHQCVSIVFDKIDELMTANEERRHIEEMTKKTEAKATTTTTKGKEKEINMRILIHSFLRSVLRCVQERWSIWKMCYGSFTECFGRDMHVNNGDCVKRNKMIDTRTPRKIEI